MTPNIVREPREINRQVARRAPLDVAWMQEVLDVYLDEHGWPALVSSSAIEDHVVATYPRWVTRRQRLREIIARALHAAGYQRQSQKGRGWARVAVVARQGETNRDLVRQVEEGCIQTGE